MSLCIICNSQKGLTLPSGRIWSVWQLPVFLIFMTCQWIQIQITVYFLSMVNAWCNFSATFMSAKIKRVFICFIYPISWQLNQYSIMKFMSDILHLEDMHTRNIPVQRPSIASHTNAQCTHLLQVLYGGKNKYIYARTLDKS